MTTAKTTPALITCGVCGSQMSLDVAIAHVGARTAIKRCLESMGDVGLGLMSYIALHRSRARQLTWEKSARLLDEILTMIDRGWIERNHDRHAVDAALWVAAFAEVKDASTKTLTLPLDGHGYLLQVLASLATKANAAKDRQQEAIARGETPNGRSAAHLRKDYTDVREDSAAAPVNDSVPMPAHARVALANFGKAKRMDAASAGAIKEMVSKAAHMMTEGINPREGAKPKPAAATFATVNGKKELVEILERKGKNVLVRLLDVAPDFAENTAIISVKDLL